MKSYNIHNRKIFDAHSHMGRFGEWKMKDNMIEPFKGREITNIEEQKKYMENLGINKAIIVPHYTPDSSISFEKYNPLVIKVVRELDNVLGGLWVSPLPQDRKMTLKVLDSLPNKGIVALKMSPDAWPRGEYTPDPETWNEEFEEIMVEIINAAKKHDLVIHFHTGSNNSNPLNYENFVKEYGEGLKIQFVHMGGHAGGHFAFIPRFIEWIKKGYDFYCDTSFNKGFGPAWMVRELVEKNPEGIKRVLFASDNPWGLFESEFWRVEGISCSDEIKDDIFFNNAEKLYS